MEASKNPISPTQVYTKDLLLLAHFKRQKDDTSPTQLYPHPLQPWLVQVTIELKSNQHFVRPETWMQAMIEGLGILLTRMAAPMPPPNMVDMPTAPLPQGRVYLHLVLPMLLPYSASSGPNFKGKKGVRGVCNNNDLISCKV